MRQKQLVSNKYMREIKFRAWDGNEMRYTGVHKKEGYQLIINFGGQPEGNAYLFDPKSLQASVSLKVESLMQYTGLKDKNGKEIYEGDIVTQTANNRGSHNVYNEVVETDPGWGVHPFNNDHEIRWDVDPEEWVIVGNKFENSELLKTK